MDFSHLFPVFFPPSFLRKINNILLYTSKIIAARILHPYTTKKKFSIYIHILLKKNRLYNPAEAWHAVLRLNVCYRHSSTYRVSKNCFLNQSFVGDYQTNDIRHNNSSPTRSLYLICNTIPRKDNGQKI